MAAKTGHKGDTGLIAWSPLGEDVGPHAVVVRVDDGHGGSAIQRFSVEVFSNNVAPTLESIQPQIIKAGSQLQFQVIANDANGDVLEFGLDTESVSEQAGACPTELIFFFTSVTLTPRRDIVFAQGGGLTGFVRG